MTMPVGVIMIMQKYQVQLLNNNAVPRSPTTDAVQPGEQKMKKKNNHDTSGWGQKKFITIIFCSSEEGCRM